MKSKKMSYKINPRYIYARLRNKYYEYKNTNLPWLTEKVNRFLEENLSKDDTVLEFGSGRSTQFFANRVKKVYSRENHQGWFEKVKIDLQNKDIQNFEYEFYSDLNQYANVDQIQDNSIDIALIDGRNRANCLINSIPKIKQGGVLILDNAERYLIYDTFSPSKWARIKRDKKKYDVSEFDHLVNVYGVAFT